jgi:hypothetical protein
VVVDDDDCNGIGREGEVRVWVDWGCQIQVGWVSGIKRTGSNRHISFQRSRCVRDYDPVGQY